MRYKLEYIEQNCAVKLSSDDLEKILRLRELARADSSITLTDTQAGTKNITNFFCEGK